MVFHFEQIFSNVKTSEILRKAH